MDVNDGVDPRDLEQADDPGVRGDDAEPARSGAIARRRDERPDAGRVEERATGEVDHELLMRDSPERLFENGRRREVELARHVHHMRTARHRLAPNVKIARRGHRDRV